MLHNFFKAQCSNLGVLIQVLHGEQYTELLAERLPTSGCLISTFKIEAVLDKGSGAVYVLEIVSRDSETNEAVVKNQLSIFVVGAGGFNGPRNSDKVVATKDRPTRKCDHSSLFQTSIDQAMQ